jgi:hypothetical protein
LKGRIKNMRKMKISIALLLSIITILAAISPALAVTPQISMAPKVPTADTWLSGNWAGYAVTGDDGSVTSVSGSWTIPTVTGSKRETSYSAFWVGIDGFNSGTVEQIGTSSDMRNGKAVYYAWYEFYPLQPMQLISTSEFAVTPGDQISASVTYSQNTFTLTITDLTNPDTYTTTKAVSSLGYTPLRNSSEWIAEAPSSGRILPLANFGTVNFGYDYTSITATCSATIGDTTLPIGQFTDSAIQQIYMGTQTTRGHTTITSLKAQPSALSTDGTSFSVTWLHS